MNIDDFRKHGKDLIDKIADYYENIESFPPLSLSQPGEVFNSIPEAPPELPEDFPDILKDFDEKILPGITHWQHPMFFGYFPANTSYPSVLAEALTAALGVQGMIWLTSPAAAELEERMMLWLRDMIGLQPDFTGVIQDTASTSTLVSILTAREKKTNYSINRSGFGDREFTVYCSVEAHSSVEKAVKIAGIGSNNLRKIPVDDNMEMIPLALEEQIIKDYSAGYTPLALVMAFGTTSSGAVDNIKALAAIGRKYEIWNHVDAAYAGSALVLPEYGYMLEGQENIDTFVFNPHKWMMTNFDCSAYFVKDKEALIRTFEIHPEYLKTSADKAVNNYRDWGIQLGRRFRALKLWFVIRSYGVKGIQDKIRHDIELSKIFLNELNSAGNFELLVEPHFNLICFRFNPGGRTDEELDELNQKLLSMINASGKMFMTHTKLRGKYCLRFVCAQTYVQERHVRNAWNIIKQLSDKLL